MNELERFLSDWAQVYALVSRLWRARRSAGAPRSATLQGSPDVSAPSPATPAPHAALDTGAALHARWTPVRPPLRDNAAPHVPEHVSPSHCPHNHTDPLAM